MDKEITGLIAVLLAFAANLPYIYGIIKGKLKPHPYSHIVWGISTLVVILVQLSNGIGLAASWSSIISIPFSLLVVILAWKHRTKDIKKFDMVCLVVALITLLLWIVADQPLLSVILITLTQLIGLVPTIRKTRNEPHEESVWLWTVNCARGFFVLFAIQDYNLTTTFNVVAWVIADVIFLAEILFYSHLQTKKYGHRLKRAKPYNHTHRKL